MCAPGLGFRRVFTLLVGGRGFYAVTPLDRYVWGGSYEPRSLIWNSRWVTTVRGIVESREALARPADPHTAVILRCLRAVDGPARIRVALDLGARFGLECSAKLA